MVVYCVFHFGRLLEAREANPKWIEEYHELQARKPVEEVEGFQAV